MALAVGCDDSRAPGRIFGRNSKPMPKPESAPISDQTAAVKPAAGSTPGVDWVRSSNGGPIIVDDALSAVFDSMLRTPGIREDILEIARVGRPVRFMARDENPDILPKSWAGTTLNSARTGYDVYINPRAIDISNGLVEGGNLIWNQARPWSWYHPYAEEAAHEFGHVLGANRVIGGSGPIPVQHTTESLFGGKNKYINEMGRDAGQRFRVNAMGSDAVLHNEAQSHGGTTPSQDEWRRLWRSQRGR